MEFKVEEVKDLVYGHHLIRVDFITNSPEYYLNGGEEGHYHVATIYPENQNDILKIVETSLNQLLYVYINDKENHNPKLNQINHKKEFLEC